MHNYRELRVWKQAVKIARETYELTDHFPDGERYGLVGQMRRASVSIASNIAEGSSRRSAKEFRRFLEIAQGSAFELDTQIAIASVRAYASPEGLDALSRDIDSLGKMLTNLRRAVSDQK